jgi:hypothetical protein
MAKLHLVMHALLGSIIVVEGWYIRELAATKGDASQGVGTEPTAHATAVRTMRVPPAPAGDLPEPTTPVVLPRAPCPDPEQLAQEVLEHKKALESSAAQAARDQQMRQSRETVAERLSLAGTELQRLEAAGEALRDAERALRERLGNGEVPDAELNQELTSLWSGTETEIERLLGRERYADFSALRREHPELGRSLYVFRAGPGDSR